MGKRSAVVELFLGDMGSIQRELRPSILREGQLTMATKLEQIADPMQARRTESATVLGINPPPA